MKHITKKIISKNKNRLKIFYKDKNTFYQK